MSGKATTLASTSSGMRFGLRWGVISLIALATVINYVDRNAFAVMWPTISKDIGADKADYALLVTCFMVAYAAGQAFFGRMFDRIGTRLGFVIAIVGWSAAIAGHALAATIVAFGFLRAALAFFEAGNWPGATKACAEWFPSRERAFAQGIFNAGASLGAVVSAPLIAAVYLALGWQGAFAAIGLVGVLWVVPWLRVYKAGPETHPGIDAQERAYILAGRHETATPGEHYEDYRPNLKQLLRHRQSWAVILARLFLDPVWWLFVSWLPIYLVQSFGFDIRQIGLFAWVPYVGAMLGSLCGGALAGALMRAGRSVDLARKATITIGGAIMLPALLLTMKAADPLLAVLLIAAILFGFQLAIGNIQTLPSDYFGGDTVGTLAGLGGAAAVVGTLITTWLVPALTQEAFAPAFAMAAALVPLAVLSVWLLGGRIEPLRPHPTVSQAKEG